jgi:hypothetical protein
MSHRGMRAAARQASAFARMDSVWNSWRALPARKSNRNGSPWVRTGERAGRGQAAVRLQYMRGIAARYGAARSQVVEVVVGPHQRHERHTRAPGAVELRATG